MPIVGAPIEESTIVVGGSVYSFDARNYSHSTVFSTYAANGSQFLHMNVAELTTVYTPSADCAERWVLAGGQTVVTLVEGSTTLAVTTPRAGTVTRMISVPSSSITIIPGAVVSSATQGFTSILGLPSPSAGATVTSSAQLLPRQNIAHNYTILSMALNGTATDPSYRSCQRYSVMPTYSPGICPSDQTVAEVTAWHVDASTGYRTFWQASCCRRSVIE